MERRTRVALRRFGRELCRAVLDGLVEPTCAGCGAPARGLCGSCQAGLVRFELGECRRCGAPLAPGSSRCLADHRPLRGLAFRRAALAYAGTGGALVRRFKFGDDGAAGLLLIREITRLGRAQLIGWPRRTLVVPIPVHARKRRARGFDQAARLADGLADGLAWTCGRGVIVRVRDTRPQGDPRTTSREANVAGAFRVARRRAVVGSHVVLVDDVTTSGATARECARVLRDAGARRVGVLTAASG